MVKVAAKKDGIKIGASIQKTILSILSERDEIAEICRNENGHPQADIRKIEKEILEMLREVAG